MVFRELTVPASLGVIALSVVCFCVGCSDSNNEIENLPALPEHISSLPLGIIVEPTESVAEAQLENADIKSLSSDTTPVYRWDHPVSIRVANEAASIQMIEYGVFVWSESQGQWFDATEEQKPYPAEAFAGMFQCENTLLEPGNTYQSDRFSNWSNMTRDKPVIARWYFIGEIDGQRVRGETTLIDMPPTK